ncbi:MAG TPA: hypothetical protein VKR43_16765, partial [Bryobacteraceae bacterium]|nr:hypothetical protein [Bryobacteraceae bacterium]
GGFHSRSVTDGIWLMRLVYIALVVCVGVAMASAPDFAISDEPTQQGPEQVSSSEGEAVSSAPYTPLDLGQRYLYALDRVVGPARLVGFVAHSGLDQVWKKPEQWGSQPESFGYRVASRFGDALLKETIRFGISAADGEDPRYFRSGHGTVWKRTGYALGHTFWVHKDDGSMMPAYSLFLADFVTPAVTQQWRPGPFTGLREIRSGTLGMGANALTNVWQEFWPDLRKKLPNRFQERLTRGLRGI